jgi:hypothetical protein
LQAKLHAVAVCPPHADAIDAVIVFQAGVHQLDP